LLALEYLGREDLAHVPKSATPQSVPPPPTTPTIAPSTTSEPTKISEATEIVVENPIKIVVGGQTSEIQNRVETLKTDLAPQTDALGQLTATLMGDAPACNVCGHITVRNGACYKCLNCGNSLGCS
ncbi:MAG: vitamin B12-dependent ribonucleotide reductase, partial [Bacteroidia bacterium]|nr:vitamin B12-dependent ribonucleotide reductase [Bacteroidia bacterium]MDW8334479.1 vitamin B12-dependent ribonucleotide reductase [Bacteroidia bacterium]